MSKSLFLVQSLKREKREMQVNFNANRAIFDADFKISQRNKESQINFQSKKFLYNLQDIKPYNYRAAFLNLNSLRRINRTSLENEAGTAEDIAQRVAETLYKYRVKDTIKPCEQSICPECIGKLKSKVLPFIEKNDPIEMLMICFPFKLPSRTKTLGSLPDKAEEIALKNIMNTISDVEKIYKPEGKPGAKFTIYHDNLIFSTAELHPSDDEAREYQRELANMAKDLELDNHIKFKTLEDVEFFDKTDAPKDLDARRQWLRDNYGAEYTPEKIKLKMQESPHYNNFVNGIMKFNQEIMKGIFVSAGEEALEKEAIGKGLAVKLDDDNYIHFIDHLSGKELDKEDLRVKKAVDFMNKVGQEALASKLGKSDNPYVRISDINGPLRVTPSKTGKSKMHDMTLKVLHLDQSWVSFINHRRTRKIFGAPSALWLI